MNTVRVETEGMIILKKHCMDFIINAFFKLENVFILKV